MKRAKNACKSEPSYGCQDEPSQAKQKRNTSDLLREPHPHISSPCTNSFLMCKTFQPSRNFCPRTSSKPGSKISRLGISNWHLKTQGNMVAMHRLFLPTNWEDNLGCMELLKPLLVLLYAAIFLKMSEENVVLNVVPYARIVLAVDVLLLPPT